MPELIPQTSTPCLASTSSILDRLRSDTATEHARLEQDLDLLGDKLSLARYQHTLTRFYGFYCPFEDLLFPRLPATLQSFFIDRLKTAKLECDLTFLGISTGNLPLCIDLPDVTHPSAMLGSLYVLEGATLGGQLISRQLETRLGLRDNRGYSFFNAYGPSTGSQWKRFRALLLEQSSSQGEDEMVRGAIATFTSMHRWLCPRGTAH